MMAIGFLATVYHLCYGTTTSGTRDSPKHGNSP